jgi:LPXTG-motif cell wall-anchored protein
MTKSLKLALVAIAVVALCAAGTGFAQATTKTELRTVDVIGVHGNTIIFKNAAGETREYTVPATQKFTVDGKEVGIADVKPGMKLTAVVETVTKPVPVKTTRIENGEIFQIQGANIVVREKDGLKSYTVPAGFRFLLDDGRVVTVADLSVGMKLTATIVSKETKMVSEQKLGAVYGKAPEAPKPAAAAPPPPPPPAAAPAPPPPAPAAAPAPEKKKLPKTASPVPFAALAGGLSLLAGLGLRFRRSR